jgi:hypothetical protein
MLDFTYLFIVFLMVFAVQANQPLVALALFGLLIAMAKSKMLILAALVGGALVLAFSAGYTDPVVLGGGFLVILILLVKNDSPGAMGAGPQGYYPGAY